MNAYLQTVPPARQSVHSGPRRRPRPDRRRHPERARRFPRPTLSRRRRRPGGAPVSESGACASTA